MRPVDDDQIMKMAERDFLRRATAFLGTNMGFSVLLKKEDLLRVAQHCIAVARSYGFEGESDLVTFAMNMLTINPGFHLQPRIHAILKDSLIPAADKTEALLRDASDEDWEQASMMLDAEMYWRRALPGF